MQHYKAKIAKLLKGQCQEKSVQTETVGSKAGYQGCVESKFYSFNLSCPLNLLRIFKFMLGPRSGVKLTSDTKHLAPPPMRL